MIRRKRKGWVHWVEEVGPDVRIVDYCGGVFPILGSKSATKKAISAGRIRLNGRPAQTGDLLTKGDLIEVRGTGVHKAKKYDRSVDIVYEDEYLIVVNKPAGIAANGNRYRTVENALSGIITSHSEDALPRPIAVHRLDVPTRGLLMLAKSKSAQIALGKAFQSGQIKKEYRAVVHGAPRERGTIDQKVDGKRAITRFELLNTVPSGIYKALSFMRLVPITGRKHQLRLHMRAAGHLILGDKAYADGQRTLHGKGLFLCATHLSFSHPIEGNEIDLEIDAPAKFFKVMEREQSRTQR
jgi:23S rRNA pseudouridine1911/1915/1917 synthase